jgi:hypothetical protein
MDTLFEGSYATLAFSDHPAPNGKDPSTPTLTPLLVAGNDPVFLPPYPAKTWPVALAPVGATTKSHRYVRSALQTVSVNEPGNGMPARVRLFSVPVSPFRWKPHRDGKSRR